MRGFSFCGKWLDEFGSVYYTPGAEIRGDQMADYEIFSEEFKGKDGGYQYGNRVKPKEFELPIFYENMTRAELLRLIAWFDRRQKGALVFEDRMYAAYEAVPSARVQLQDHKENRNGEEKHHGTMTVYLTAYDPLATLLVTAGDDDLMGADNEVMMLPVDCMPDEPTASSKSFLIYNPGTEMTPTVIRLAGDCADELTIENKTTGQVCVIRGMTSGITSDAGRHIEISSATGRVEMVGASRELAFELHDKGYIS